jgi:hypothetical protein
MLVNKTGFRKKKIRFQIEQQKKKGKWGTFIYVIVKHKILSEDKTAILWH